MHAYKKNIVANPHGLVTFGNTWTAVHKSSEENMPPCHIACNLSRNASMRSCGHVPPLAGLEMSGFLPMGPRHLILVASHIECG